MVSMLTEPIEIMSGDCVKLSNTKDGVLLIIDAPSNRLTRRSNVGFVISTPRKEVPCLTPWTKSLVSESFL